jgi:hypothetical protein
VEFSDGSRLTIKDCEYPCKFSVSSEKSLYLQGNPETDRYKIIAKMNYGYSSIESVDVYLVESGKKYEKKTQHGSVLGPLDISFTILPDEVQYFEDENSKEFEYRIVLKNKEKAYSESYDVSGKADLTSVSFSFEGDDDQFINGECDGSPFNKIYTSSINEELTGKKEFICKVTYSTEGVRTSRTMQTKFEARHVYNVMVTQSFS